MCALSSHLFPSYGCLLENAASHDQNDLSKGTGTLESVFHFPSSLQPEIELGQSSTGGTVASASNPTVSKKLNHNAKERDRRRQINCLFSSLRSLLPAADQMKNLTNPATVSLALKYIPEIQQQLETLLQKKDLLSRISSQARDLSERKKLGESFLPATTSVNQLNGSELMIQISTYHKILLSDILSELEEDGLQLINASSFQSCEGIVFYSLHLKSAIMRTEHSAFMPTRPSCLLDRHA
ncbi:hypothetical protein CRYUN_Cryun16bG0068400 [Craigia yunnanensis]